MKKTFLFMLFLIQFSAFQLKAKQKPNVLILYTDDKGKSKPGYRGMPFLEDIMKKEHHTPEVDSFRMEAIDGN